MTIFSFSAEVECDLRRFLEVVDEVGIRIDGFSVVDGEKFGPSVEVDAVATSMLFETLCGLLKTAT